MALSASGSRWLLLDKSALVRAPELDPALGEPCLCAITRFEVLYSARSPRGRFLPPEEPDQRWSKLSELLKPES